MALDPGDHAKQETLAHVYQLVGPDARERAIAAHQKLIAHDPHRTDSYLALAKLYGETGETDKRWCVAATLWYLKKNTPALDELFQRHRPPRARAALRPFTDETWRRVRHPDEDVRIGDMFAVASPFLAVSAAYDPAHVGLKKREQVDLQQDGSLWARTLVELGRNAGAPASRRLHDGRRGRPDHLGQCPPPQRPAADAAARAPDDATEQLRSGLRSGAALFVPAAGAVPQGGVANAAHPARRPRGLAGARDAQRRATARG